MYKLEAWCMRNVIIFEAFYTEHHNKKQGQETTHQGNETQRLGFMQTCMYLSKSLLTFILRNIEFCADRYSIAHEYGNLYSWVRAASIDSFNSLLANTRW